MEVGITLYASDKIKFSYWFFWRKWIKEIV